MVAALLLGITSLGCVDDGTEDPASSTSVLESSELAPLSGRIGGTSECPWLDTGDARFLLLLSQGDTARSTDGRLELVDADGSVVGRQGDTIDVVGGTQTDVEPPDACDTESIDFIFRVGQLGPP